MPQCIRFAALITCILATAGCEGLLCPLPYRSLAPFEGKVIDVDTKEPIKGAAVLAIYHFEIFGIAGADWHVKDGQDTVTDENGEFKLSRKRRWFVSNRGYPRGRLEIFKPGYGTLWHERSKAVGDNKSWPTPGKHIIYELPKLNTEMERKRNLPGKIPFSKIPYKNQKLYIDAINTESANLGIPLYTIPTEE